MARTYGRVAIYRRVLVNLKSGTAIEGVLWEDRGPLLLLKDAALHTHGGSTPLDGQVIVERSEIDFTQVVG